MILLMLATSIFIAIWGCVNDISILEIFLISFIVNGILLLAL